MILLRLHIYQNTAFIFFLIEQPTPMRRELNGTYYYMFENLDLRMDARRACGYYYPQGDLAEIDTPEKLNFLRQMIVEKYGSKF